MDDATAIAIIIAAPLKGRAFKIEISKVSGSALAAEICTGPHNRLLRRQHCSSLCSQSEGHEHVANMVSAQGHDIVGFSVLVRHNIRPPSLCEQSELQCCAPFSATRNSLIRCYAGGGQNRNSLSRSPRASFPRLNASCALQPMSH